MDTEDIRKTCLEFLDKATAFLDRLVRFESISGYEGPAMSWVYEQFFELADVCEKLTVPKDIINDPEYSQVTYKQPYEGRPNVRVVLRGDGSGQSVIFNAHVDVVPPTNKQEHPFEPYIEDGAMYGRGACDDKGQVVVLWVMLNAMKKLGIRPKGDVIFHLVIEEEPGGNGTLALIRRGESADCCINLEPCSNDVCTSIRGAVWFTGTCYGRAGHSGTGYANISALNMAMEAMKILEEYRDELLARTINDDPLFASMENPMPINFGELHAGDWPTIAPEQAVFKGIFGLLTTPKETVMHEMAERVKTRGSEWMKDNFEITFPYRHDSSIIDPELPFVKILTACYDAMRVKSRLRAAKTSMDAWLYNNILKVPTCATGCGNLEDAHTINEHVVLHDVVTTAAVLILFVREWCGFKED